MAENPWVPFYFADYLADTGTLTLAEHGAYLLLMAEAYRRGGTLDANASALHRLCRCTTEDERSAVDTILTRFFTKKRGGFSHGRIEKVLARRDEISKKRSDAARERWDANAGANASDLHMQPQPQSESQSESQSEPETEPPRSVVEKSPRETKKPKPRRWRKVPADWKRTPQHEALARERGVSIDLEEAKYRDHEFDRPKSDADATFRNWLRSAKPDGRASPRVDEYPGRGRTAGSTNGLQRAGFPNGDARNVRPAASSRDYEYACPLCRQMHKTGQKCPLKEQAEQEEHPDGNA